VRIPLTKGHYTLIDVADWQLVKEEGPWQAVWSRWTNGYYAQRPRDLPRGLHGLLVGDAQGKEVDHISHDTLDNRRSNLRLVVRAQNARNRVKHKVATSRFLGVYWNGKCRKWAAQIRRDKHATHLGLFESETEAARAYAEAARNQTGLAPT